jgi:hypothetical protein
MPVLKKGFYMAAENDKIDYDKLFPFCIGCSNHTRQHRGGTRCWGCARYRADLYAVADTKEQNGHIAQQPQPAIALADLMEILHNEFPDGVVQDIWPLIKGRQQQAVW